MRDLSVLREVGDGTYVFDLDTPPRSVTGTQLLIQKVILTLLSDNLEGHGVGVPAIFEDLYDQPQSRVYSRIAEAVSLALSQIRSTTSPKALPSEQLTDLRLISIDNAAGHWSMEIAMEAVDGTTSLKSLTF